MQSQLWAALLSSIDEDPGVPYLRDMCKIFTEDEQSEHCLCVDISQKRPENILVAKN